MGICSIQNRFLIWIRLSDHVPDVYFEIISVTEAENVTAN